MRSPDIGTANDKLALLDSLLTVMYGVGQEAFENIGPFRRDNLIELAAKLLSEAMQALSGEEVQHG